MIPPTPTTLPPGSEVVHLGTTYDLWTAVGPAIQMWNFAGDLGRVLQVVVLLALVVVGMAVLVRFVHKFTRKDAED